MEIMRTRRRAACASYCIQPDTMASSLGRQWNELRASTTIKANDRRRAGLFQLLQQRAHRQNGALSRRLARRTRLLARWEPGPQYRYEAGKRLAAAPTCHIGGGTKRGKIFRKRLAPLFIVKNRLEQLFWTLAVTSIPGPAQSGRRASRHDLKFRRIRPEVTGDRRRTMPKPFFHFRHDHNSSRTVSPRHSIEPFLNLDYRLRCFQFVPAASVVVPHQDQTRVFSFLHHGPSNLRSLFHHSRVAAWEPPHLKRNRADLESLMTTQHCLNERLCVGVGCQDEKIFHPSTREAKIDARSGLPSHFLRAGWFSP